MPLTVEQRLRPRVRVGLAHDHVVTVGIHFPALIAGDDPRRYSGGAKQDGECAGIVLAESAAGVEQESIDRIAVEQRRRQRIDERLIVKPFEHGIDVRAVGIDTLTHFLGEGERARIIARQLQTLARIVVGARIGVAKRRSLGIADRLHDRRLGNKLLVVGQVRGFVARRRQRIVVWRARQR